MNWRFVTRLNRAPFFALAMLGFPLGAKAVFWGQGGVQDLSRPPTWGEPLIVERILAGGVPTEQTFDRRFSSEWVTAPYGSFGEVDFSGSHLRTLSQSYGEMLRGTEVALPSEGSSLLMCGPSLAPREMRCVSQVTGETLANLPLPGDLSAAPLFHNGSWVIATTKGFLFRVVGLSDEGTPVLGSDNLSFWGAQSRSRMAFLRDTYRAATEGASGEGADLRYVQSSWGWYHWSSSPFVSPLLIQGSRLVAMTSNQFIHAFDFDSGKLVWAQRISKDEQLRIRSRALAVSSRYIIAGTSDSRLLFLDPATGKISWQIALPDQGQDRFQGVTAQPLVAGQRIVASNGSSSTVLINERSQQVEWSLPVGSVASPKRFGENIFVGTLDGRVLRVDFQSGKILATVSLSPQEPVASLAVLSGAKRLLVALRSGRVIVLDLADLNEVQEFESVGIVFGEFLDQDESRGVCLSTQDALVRCFAEDMRSRG